MEINIKMIIMSILIVVIIWFIYTCLVDSFEYLTPISNEGIQNLTSMFTDGNVILPNVNIANGNIVGGNIVGTTMSETTLNNPVILNGNITNSNIVGVSSSGGMFANAALVNPNITNGTLSNVTISNSTYENGTYNNPIINNATLNTPKISGLTYANISISNPTITAGLITGASIAGSIINNARIGSPIIISPNVSNGTFTTPNISNGIFSNITSTGGTFTTPNIVGGVMSNVVVDKMSVTGESQITGYTRMQYNPNLSSPALTIGIPWTQSINFLHGAGWGSYNPATSYGDNLIYTEGADLSILPRSATAGGIKIKQDGNTVINGPTIFSGSVGPVTVRNKTASVSKGDGTSVKLSCDVDEILLSCACSSNYGNCDGVRYDTDKSCIILNGSNDYSAQASALCMKIGSGLQVQTPL